MARRTSWFGHFRKKFGSWPTGAHTVIAAFANRTLFHFIAMTAYRIPLVNTSPISVRRLALHYGTGAFGLMLVYFFAVNALRLQQHDVLRFGCYVFTIGGVFLAIRAYKVQAPGPAPYLAGLGLGFLVGLISSGLFAGFIFLYFFALNRLYPNAPQDQTYFRVVLNPFMLAGTIALLGVVIGGVTGYILMMSDGTDGTGRSGESTGN